MKAAIAQTLLRASATTIGLAVFAILLSYVITELYFRVSGTFVPSLQMFSFELLQLSLALFCLWPNLRRSDFRCQPGKLAGSVLIGLVMAFWLSTAVRQFIGFETLPSGYSRLTHGELLMGSSAFHGIFWLFYSGFLVPIAENLLYRHLIFKVANDAPAWPIGLASLLTYMLAYAFNGGIEGMLFATQLGLVVTVLRVRTSSALCPIIANMTYGVIAEGCTLGLYLP